MKLNFSEFHPLDHRIGSRYCRQVTNFPDAPKGWGNILRHYKLWKAYKAPDYPIMIFLHRNLRCRFGKHVMVRCYKPKPGVTWQSGPPTGPDDTRFTTTSRCEWCDYRLR